MGRERRGNAQIEWGAKCLNCFFKKICVALQIVKV